MIWQPIEGAPKDGTYILGYRDTGYADPYGGRIWCMYVTAYDGVHKCWTEGGFDSATPTHWMPLPEPPEEARYTITEAGRKALEGRK